MGKNWDGSLLWPRETTTIISAVCWQSSLVHEKKSIYHHTVYKLACRCSSKHHKVATKGNSYDKATLSHEYIGRSPADPVREVKVC